ncbi:MAG: hypothetical protein AMXMBFR53_29980 [Gemmatimonadota bacterium]
MIALADLKLDLRLTGTADDAYVTNLEASAVAYIQKRTNRYFGAEAATTEYVTGDGTTKLWLSEAPTTLPSTLLERAYPGSTSSTTVTASASDGYTQRGMCLVRKGYLWTRGYEYEVTYTRGYAAGSEPEDIQRAVRGLVVHWFEQRLPLGDVGVNASANIVPHHVDAIIRAWTRRPW